RRTLSQSNFHRRFFCGPVRLFGRNHALYNFLAQASLLLLLHFKLSPPLSIWHFGMWVAGIVTGLVPTIMMFVGVPGFFASYIEVIQSNFRHGTNLSLPIPWPWRVSLNSGDMTQLLLGIFLVALPLGYCATSARYEVARSDRPSRAAVQ